MKRSVQFIIAAQLLLIAGLLLAVHPAQAQTYTLTTLATFNGSNGANPEAGLILSGGTLYGTTWEGGDLSRNNGSGYGYGYGTVFSVPAAGGAVTTLATFNGGNGGFPGNLILSGGTLYGTTYEGGDLSLEYGYGLGTVFSVPAGGGAVTTLATFNGTNGEWPLTSLILSGGALYGTTFEGGDMSVDSGFGYGEVFSVPITGGAVTTLATFNGANGGYPGNLMLSGGTLYGTTSWGGAGGAGTVFSVPIGGGAVTTLGTFNGSNGSGPYAGLILSGGTLYGTTQIGGDLSLNGEGAGTVFSVPAGGGAVTTLATFTGGNGWFPGASLILSGGSLYGTTAWGGDQSLNGGLGYGTVFSVPAAGGAVTTLATFNGSNGADPECNLIRSGDTLYGTTARGGAGGDGTVFSLTPTPAGSTYALWNDSGVASLWKIPATGSVASASFGPYSGWAPAALASDTSSNAYILWTTAAGAASVWQVSSSLKVTTTQSFGPYKGWSAKSIAVGPDGHVHMLWNHTSDNEASIFNIVLGSSASSQAFGPFKGWQATQIAVDSNNNTRLLWTDTSVYEASLWNITSGGVQRSQAFGPYSGWQAQSLAVDPDNQARMLWENTSTKQASIFTVATDGTFISQPFGPYSGWTPAGLAVNNDGDSDLMWNSTANQLSIFDVTDVGTFTSRPCGPFSGWKAIAIAPGP